MNKLLTTLFTTALLSSGFSPLATISSINNYNQATVEPTTKFNEWDLSTWGAKQKQIIATSYITSASKWYKQQQTTQSRDWYSWNVDNHTGNDFATSTAFNLINSAFGSYLNKSGFFVYFYQPEPSQTTDLKALLAKGIRFYIKAMVYKPRQVFTGELSIMFKGNI